MSATRPEAMGAAERVLALVGRASAGAEAEVMVRLGREALTRFANSRIHQNMDGSRPMSRCGWRRTGASRPRRWTGR